MTKSRVGWGGAVVGMTDLERLDHYLNNQVADDPETGCWVALHRPSHHGYVRLKVNGRVYAAHRWVYEQMVVEIPAGLEIDHLCRNTSCVNPAHLEPVSHDENMRRTRLEFCRRGLHRLSEDNIYHYSGRGKGRTCKTCTLDRLRAARVNKQAVS